MGLYPLMLELGGREIVIVGGGRVALRKYRALQESGAHFTVISPEINDGFEAVPEAFRWIPEKFSPELLEHPFLVLACTDNRETNSEVARCCREKRIPVSVCDDPGSSDFVFPAVVSEGSLKIAVSTCGECPGLARQIRDEIAAEQMQRYRGLAEQAGEERRWALQSHRKKEKLEELENHIKEKLAHRE